MWVALGAGAARGHGAFPQTRSVAFQPGNDQKIWVGTTWGLAYSPDDGASWSFVCEQALGYTGIHDPVYGVTTAGTLFETIYDGLRISRDGGCTWNLAGNGLDGLWIADLQVAGDDAVWIATRANAIENDVFVSRDDGTSFAAAGLAQPGVFWKSLRVAPSDPSRLYVSGYRRADVAVDAPRATALLYRSDNATAVPGEVVWQQTPWSDGESQTLLLGVSRANADQVFVSYDEGRDDRVFQSDDGGLSWRERFRFVDDDASAFVSSADGRTLIIGSTFMGAKISRDAGMTWEDLAGAPQMSCAGVRPADEDYFSCGANWEPDQMAFGRSLDLATWTKLFRFVEIAGPLDCPAGTPQHDDCAPDWCQVCQQFGCPDPRCARPPDAGPAVDGGAAADDGGSWPCGCAAGGRAGATGGALLLAFALLGLRMRH
jgi:hypothetical protein